MSHASATAPSRSEDSSVVDAALRSWRAETDVRRERYQEQLAADQLEQQERWQWFTRRAVAVAVASLAAIGVGYLALPQPGHPVVASPAWSTVPTAHIGGSRLSAERTEHIVKSAVPMSSVKHWTREGALFVQFDYEGAPLSLHWTDGAGRAVLDGTPCNNRLIGGGRRCYVGRTEGRIQQALAHGSQPGTWTASACDEAKTCSPVATFEVR